MFKKCPKCLEVQNSSNLYCYNCGYDLSKTPPDTCFRCGHTLLNFYRYCPNCGVRIPNYGVRVKEKDKN